MKYTAQMIKMDLAENNPEFLKQFYTGAKDRMYQIWKRDSLSVALDAQWAVEQKINYIHKNPIVEKWNLVDEPDKYKYSSAKFYYRDIDEFGILENYMGI